MKPGHIYKHKYCRDVAIFVMKKYDLPRCLKLRVRWINVVNPKNHFDMGVVDRINIQWKDVKDWKELK